MNPCISPVPPKPINPADGDRWFHIHNRFLTETKDREPDVVILGDSIMSQMEQRNIWKEVFAPMHTLNFSIIGDEIQNILWRIHNGELDNIKPKVIVLYTGALNVRSSTPEDVIEGIILTVKAIREKQPNALILVQEQLPRGLNPNPLRDAIEKLNSLLTNSLQDMNHCKVIPVGSGIVKPDGTISHTDLLDWFYPTNEGFLKAFGPLIQELKSVLQESNAP